MTPFPEFDVPGAPPASIYYQPDFLDPFAAQDLFEMLQSVPVVPFHEHDPVRVFAFSHPVYDGFTVTSRREACAGDPVWHDGRFVAAVPMPSLIAELADQLDRAVQETLDADRVALPSERRNLTSVFIDWYDDGGSFVPHTDRDGYGPVVVGLSVGDGSGLMTFSNPEDGQQFSFRIASRSAYLFRGPVRDRPWVHAISDVTGMRVSLTFRSHGENTENTATQRGVRS